jgi:hypothetical protein
MKRKKWLIMLPLILASLAGCNKKPEDSSSIIDDPDGTSITTEDSTNTEEEAHEVTIYFNLTEYGRLDGEAGHEIPNVGLQYGVEYTAMSGSLLPGSDRVTRALGAKFLGFAMQNPLGGGLQKITKVPGADGVILEAQFGEDGTSEGGGTTEPVGEEGVYFVVNGEYLESNRLTEGYSTVLETEEYSFTNKYFEAGFTFMIGSPNDISGLGANTYPTKLSGKEDGIGYTLSADNNKPNFTSTYLEVLGTPDEQGESEDGTFIKYFDSEPGQLSFKTSGEFNVYVSFFDNFGWVRVYVEPAGDIGGGDGDGDGGETTEPIGEDGVYLVTDGEYLPEYKLALNTESLDGNTEYYITGLTVEAGFTFVVGSPNDVSGLGDNVYPTFKSGKADIGYTLKQDTSKPNYTFDHLEVLGTPSDQGDSGEGKWYGFVSPNPLGELRFKTAGTYDIYIAVYDNYGWLGIYVEPSA